jgi:hypothetical protein
MLVQVGLEYRYMPPVAKLIEIVKGGNLGPVKMVAIREHRFPFLVKVYKAVFLSLQCSNPSYGPMLVIGRQLEPVQC